MKDLNTTTGKPASRRKGKKRMLWIIPVAIVVLLAAGIGIVLKASEPGRREIMELPIDGAAFAGLHNGTYTGQYKGATENYRDTTVQVTVNGGKVTDIQPVGGINLIKDGKPVEIRQGQTIFDLYDRVMEAQSLQVDVITGATLTSKTHLKAIENAVDQAEDK